MAHYFGKFEDSMLTADPVFAGHSQSYARASLVNHALGSVMTGLSVCEIAPGGTLDPHVHSFEEGFYVLEARRSSPATTSRTVSGPATTASSKSAGCTRGATSARRRCDGCR